MLKIYAEFAGREICIFNIHHGAVSQMRRFFCVPRLIGHIHREATLFNDCELLYDEKVHTTHGLSRSGRMCVYPTPYWGQEVCATLIIYLYRLYIIWDYFHLWVPAQLVFFNPNY